MQGVKNRLSRVKSILAEASELQLRNEIAIAKLTREGDAFRARMDTYAQRLDQYVANSDALGRKLEYYAKPLRFLACLVAILATTPLAVAETAATPDFSKEAAEITMPEGGPPSATLEWEENEEGQAVLRIRPAESYRRGTFSLRMKTNEAVTTPWLVIEFSLRAVAEGERSSQVGMEVLLRGRNVETGRFETLFSRPATVGLQWERIQYAVRMERHWPAGDLQVVVKPLYFSPVTEIADLALRPANEKPGFGERQVYPGQEPDAPWRARAAESIDRHRRGPLAIRVIGIDGQPVPGATVRIGQQRHLYPFGTAVVAQRVVNGPRHLFDPDFTEVDHEARNADNAVYRKKLQSLFNYVVFENDLKWPFWSEPRHWTRPEWTLEALQWLDRKDFLIKGHTLVWGSWRNTPDWLRQYESEPDELQDRILEHIADIGAATRDWVDHWDVLNEPMSHRDIIEIVGMEGVAEWFKKAREVMPGVKLIINDFDIVGNNGSPGRQDRFYAFIGELLERGAPIDGIGFQSHFWSTRLTPPETIWATADRFATLGLPLYVTEFDMNFPDEKVQAAYTRDFLTAWFSHPKTAGFIMWGFWGGSHWFGEAGAMYRKNWDPKPNASVYKERVFADWWTDATATTPENGTARFRPFYGTHHITIEDDGLPRASRLIRHSPGSPAEIVVILHDPNP